MAAMIGAMNEREREDREIEREERAIYWIITIAISPVVIGLLLKRTVIDAGGTLSLILVSLGIVGLLAGLRAFTASRVPRARIRRRGRF